MLFVTLNVQLYTVILRQIAQKINTLQKVRQYSML